MEPGYVIVGSAAFTLGMIAASGGFLGKTIRHYRAALAARTEVVKEQVALTRATATLAGNLVEKLSERERHGTRVTELLEANNRLLERARKAEAELAERREEIELLEAELDAARADAQAEERQANTWAAIAHQLGYQSTAAAPKATLQ